ncbi:MAG: ferric reductase-like transmembrane domain-containing protein [Oscillospiraceae bacterium]|jgi:DMSO/TMAO reductase YedYZ heme-binding membrane subunit|nr:ferric reductase-like transmembrane domain-containing protein [Oscillospiraceae bacterium]
MIFLGSLVFSVLLCRVIRKLPWLFYSMTGGLILATFAAYFLTDYTTWPLWFMNCIVMPIVRGGMSTAVFALVMYVGALPKKFPLYRQLYVIRSELSILGCILALAHVAYYGMYYFPHLFTEPGELAPPYIAASIMSLALTALGLPLGVTSIKKVRRKMGAIKWKKLQRWAYPFYALLYTHIMTVMGAALYHDIHNTYGRTAEINASQTQGDIITIAAYSLVFVPYFVLRIRKALTAKRQRNAPAFTINRERNI